MKTAPHLHRDTRFASSQISEIHAKRTCRAAQWNPRFFLENLISLHYIFNLSDCGKGDRNCSYQLLYRTTLTFHRDPSFGQMVKKPTVEKKYGTQLEAI